MQNFPKLTSVTQVFGFMYNKVVVIVKILHFVD
jgi:hypothetical protein